MVFFTGLSGSGKSTIARALHDQIIEDGRRTVTSLDGDVVRRNLSAGLTFSKADRETNIRRIGWVAAEIARHRGIAICSPIAPFDETRKQVRQMVEDAGGDFVLVHVATPLEECERRDRKGLYAKARAGEIPEFTGISSPYEEPEDAAVRIDTTGRTVSDCLDEVLPHLPFHQSVVEDVHWRRGSPNLRLAGLLMVGSVPFALAGGFIVKSVGDSEAQQEFLTTAIGYRAAVHRGDLHAADVPPAALRHRRQRD